MVNYSAAERLWLTVQFTFKYLPVDDHSRYLDFQLYQCWDREYPKHRLLVSPRSHSVIQADELLVLTDVGVSLLALRSYGPFSCKSELSFSRKARGTITNMDELSKPRRP